MLAVTLSRCPQNHPVHPMRPLIPFGGDSATGVIVQYIMAVMLDGTIVIAEAAGDVVLVVDMAGSQKLGVADGDLGDLIVGD